MPVLVLISVGMALALWWLGSSGRLPRRRACRWQPVGQKGSLSEFRCETCKVTAYSQDPRGPRECKRRLGGGL